MSGKNDVTVYSSRDPIFDCNREDCPTDHVNYENAENCQHESESDSKSTESGSSEG